MNKKILSKDQPLVPYVNTDGQCYLSFCCLEEVYPTNKACPSCNQALDWSWFGKKTK